MYDNLTKDDIKKMQEEIEYRKLVVRKEALESFIISLFSLQEFYFFFIVCSNFVHNLPVYYYL